MSSNSEIFEVFVSAMKFTRKRMRLVAGVVLFSVSLFGAQAMAQGFPAAIGLGDLDGTNGFSLDIGKDNSSDMVSASGDINGDGIDDVIIGAPFENEASAGAVYVVFGTSAGLTPSIELFDDTGASLLNGSNGFVINGENNFSKVGASVGVGDINGDGVDDVLIGAPFEEPGGAVFVVFGHTGAFGASLGLNSLNGTTGFFVRGDVFDDEIGISVAAGDLNNDGVDDLIIGARKADPGGRSAAGITYIFFGHTSFFHSGNVLDIPDGTIFTAIHGEAANSESGYSVSSGDMDDDGITDLLIGAPGIGTVYMLLGFTGVFPAEFELSALDEDTGTKVVDGSAFSQFGFSVTAGGDFNGDGIVDGIIGAPFNNTGSPEQAGAAYVVFGDNTGLDPVFDVATLDGSNGFAVHGLNESAQFGFAVGMGDPNADGRADIIIGAPRGDSGAADSAGVAYVVFGQTASLGASFDLATLDGTNGFIINGESAFDQTSMSVNGAGDINGDGAPDVVLSSRDRAIGSVVFGKPAAADATTVFTSLLPAARGGYVGGPVVTVFFSANNAGANQAQNCRITVPVAAPVTLSYQETNILNAPIGVADTPFSLNPGQTRSFVLAFTPNATSTGVDIFPDVDCDNANVSPIPGVNTLFLSIDANPVPDVLSIGATLDANGIITVPIDGASFMTAAATNIGVGGAGDGSQDVEVAVSATTRGANLDVVLTVCELNVLSICLEPPVSPDIAATIGSGASFFAVFVADKNSGGIALDPANSRVFLEFIEFGAPGGAITRSVTSAAVRVQ